MADGLGGPVCELDFLEVEARDFNPDEAASVADISTIESSSDRTTGLLPLRVDCFLDFSDGTATLDGSGLSGMEDLVDLRAGAGTSSTSSSSSSLITNDVLVLLVCVEALGVAADRPFRGGGSCWVTSSLTAEDPSLAAPRLRLTGGGESFSGCSSSTISETPLSAGFDRAETRVLEVVDGGFFVREGNFSEVSSVPSPSTSARPRFLRDVENFSSGGTECDTDRVVRRGGMANPRVRDERVKIEGRDRDASQGVLLSRDTLDRVQPMNL